MSNELKQELLNAITSLPADLAVDRVEKIIRDYIYSEVKSIQIRPSIENAVGTKILILEKINGKN